MRRLVITLALAVALAGCLGGATEDAVDPATGGGGDGGDGPGVTPPGNATNGTNASAAWTTTWMNGTVNGANAALFAVGGTSEEFTVPEGATTLVLNITAADGEVWVSVYSPDCSGGFTDSCGESVQTEGGTATWTAENPAPGAWGLNIFRGSPGAGAVDYAISAAHLAPAGQ